MLLTNFGSIPSQNTGASSSYPSGYSYGKSITIPATSIDANLSYFPVSVYLNSDNFEFSHAQYTGNDIYFSSDSLGATKLKFEKAEYGGGGINYSSDDTGGLYLPDISDFDFGTADYCIEMKVKLYADGVNYILYDDRPSYNAGHYIMLFRNASNYLSVEINNTVRITSSTTLLAGNTYDICLARVSGTTRLFINGAVEGTPYTDPHTNVSSTPNIGTCYNSASSFCGDIYGVRVTNGNGRYSSTYTPPLIFTDDSSYVKACINFKEKFGSTTFTDLCGNTLTKRGSKTLTAIGAVGIFNVNIPAVDATTDTVFYMWHGNESAYNTETNAFRDLTGKEIGYNGSAAELKHYANCAYFDRNNSVLSLADSDDWAFGSNDFTVEAIINMAQFPDVGWSYSIFSHYQDASNYFHFFIYRDSSYIYLGQNVYIGGVNYTSGMSKIWSPSVDTDYHIAWSRSGDTMRYFCDGVQVGTNISHMYSSTRIDIPNLTGDVVVVGGQTLTANEFRGYMKGIRITKGTARYTTTFTAPNYFIKDTNTVLCMNFQELEGTTTFYDACGKTVTTNGNVIAYRLGEPKRTLIINGTDNNYISLSDSDDWAIGTGDYTLEFLIYPNSVVAVSGSVYLWTQFTDANNYIRYSLYRDETYIYMYYQIKSGGADIASSAKGIIEYAANVPYHIAWSRISGATKVFCNGTQRGTDITDTADYPNLSSGVQIGAYGGSNTFDGQIRGCRFTKGTGRYTTTFTPPTSFTVDSANVKFCSNFDSIYDKNYLAVEHIGSSLTDATGRGNIVTNYNTTTVNTNYGTLRSFASASSQYMRIPQAKLKPANQLTLLTLAYPAPAGDWSMSKCAIIGFNESGGYGINVNNAAANMITFTCRQNNTYTPSTDYSYDSPADGYHVVSATADGRYRNLYIDGISVANTDMGATYTIDYASAVDVLLGADPSNSGPETGTYFNGYIGETRISDIARSAAWLKAESLSLKNSLLTITTI